MDDQCSFSRCRNLTDVGYIGRGVCIEHWEQICNADGKTKKRLLKRIGLVRNNEGSIVPITDTEKS